MIGILIVIVSFFAAYGVVQMIARSTFYLRTQKVKKPLFVSRVIGVKDCEDVIEGIIRSIAWEDLREEIVILDFGSTDQTKEIVYRLMGEYPFLSVKSLSEYENHLKTQIVQ